MSKIQDIIASMIHPCEYVGGPLDGEVSDAVAAPYVWLPCADGIYSLQEETNDGRLVYRWKKS